MPGENNEFDMAGAVADIGDGLGFGSDDAGEGLADSGNLDGSSDGAGTDPGLAVEGQGSAVPEGEGAPAAEVPPVASTAPRTWRPEAVAEWDKLPPAVQQEVLKREEDIFKGIEGYKQDAAFGKNVQSVLAPYDNVMKQYNIDPIRQVGDMMNAHYTLALGTEEQKHALFRQVAADYNIDLNKVFGVSADGQQPYTDPEVAALRAELNSVKSVTTTIQQERTKQQQVAIESEVSQFAADPANIYFKDVVKDMAHLIQTNQAASVKDAYEKAIWNNPAVRAREIDRIQADKSAKAAKDAEAKAAAAKRALGANVRSSAKSGSAAAPLGSMDDTIAETLAKITARS